MTKLNGLLLLFISLFSCSEKKDVDEVFPVAAATPDFFSFGTFGLVQSAAPQTVD